MVRSKIVQVVPGCCVVIGTVICVTAPVTSFVSRKTAASTPFWVVKRTSSRVHATGVVPCVQVAPGIGTCADADGARVNAVTRAVTSVVRTKTLALRRKVPPFRSRPSRDRWLPSYSTGGRFTPLTQGDTALTQGGTPLTQGQTPEKARRRNLWRPDECSNRTATEEGVLA